MNIDLLDAFNQKERFENLSPAGEEVAKDLQRAAGEQGIHASEEAGNSDFQTVDFPGRTASTCYPQKDLKAEDLLPSGESKAIQEFNISKPVLIFPSSFVLILNFNNWLGDKLIVLIFFNIFFSSEIISLIVFLSSLFNNSNFFVCG